MSESKKEGFKKMKESLSNLMKRDYEGFIKALISIETGMDNEVELKKVYDYYMENDNLGLLNERISEYKK